MRRQGRMMKARKAVDIITIDSAACFYALLKYACYEKTTLKGALEAVTGMETWDALMMW